MHKHQNRIFNIVHCLVLECKISLSSNEDKVKKKLRKQGTDLKLETPVSQRNNYYSTREYNKLAIIFGSVSA